MSVSYYEIWREREGKLGRVRALRQKTAGLSKLGINFSYDALHLEILLIVHASALRVSIEAESTWVLGSGVSVCQAHIPLLVFLL